MIADGELTVVMYHYVRDLARSRFPLIKGLSLERFRGQIAYLRRERSIVALADVLAAARGEEPLPPRAVLLTFDDGYVDHYRYVLPILREAGIQGLFFPPARVLRERRVLDVNKIHFTLAACGDPAPIAEHCLRRISELRREFDLESPEVYLERFQHASRFDDATTAFVKRLLQRGLPEAARSRLATELFSRFVTEDEAAFAEDLYLTLEQVGDMSSAGMDFGAHGLTHRWLDDLDETQQRAELAGGLEFLRDLGQRPGQFTIAYPYGGFNDITLAVAADLDYSLGFTVEPRTASVGRDHALQIPRLDAANVPSDHSGPPST